MVRSGLSSVTVPVFLIREPTGNSDASRVRFTVGPPASIGSCGTVPIDGPGSALFAGNNWLKDVEKTPAVRIAEISSK